MSLGQAHLAINLNMQIKMNSRLTTPAANLVTRLNALNRKGNLFNQGSGFSTGASRMLIFAPLSA